MSLRSVVTANYKYTPLSFSRDMSEIIQIVIIVL